MTAADSPNSILDPNHWKKEMGKYLRLELVTYIKWIYAISKVINMCGGIYRLKFKDAREFDVAEVIKLLEQCTEWVII